MHDGYGTPYYVTIARLCGAAAEPAFLKAWSDLVRMDLCDFSLGLSRFPHTTGVRTAISCLLRIDGATAKEVWHFPDDQLLCHGARVFPK